MQLFHISSSNMPRVFKDWVSVTRNGPSSPTPPPDGVTLPVWCALIVPVIPYRVISCWHDVSLWWSETIETIIGASSKVEGSTLDHRSALASYFEERPYLKVSNWASAGGLNYLVPDANATATLEAVREAAGKPSVVESQWHSETPPGENQNLFAALTVRTYVQSPVWDDSNVGSHRECGENIWFSPGCAVGQCGIGNFRIADARQVLMSNNACPRYKLVFRCTD